MLEKIKDILIKKIEAEQKEIEEIKNEYDKSQIYPTIIAPKNKFNFWERHISKRKEFAEYSKTHEKNIEEFRKRHNELKEKVNMYMKTQKEEILIQKLVDVKNAKTLSQMGISWPECVKILRDNDIKISNEDCAELVEISPDECTKDAEIMKRAVAFNLSTLGKDKTNSDEVYLTAIEEIKKKLEEDFSKGKIDEEKYQKNLTAIENDKNEIMNSRQVEMGKYKVPHKYLYEKIRKWVDEGSRFDKLATDSDYSWISKAYHLADGQYSEEYGKTIEELYEREDVLLGMHMFQTTNREIIDGIDPEQESIERVKKIFKEGLRNTRHGGGDSKPDESAVRTLARTVKIKNSGSDPLYMLDALNYNLDIHTIILTIPPKGINADLRNAIPIWGNDDKEDIENYYILPQYIYGEIIKNNGENQIELNNIEKKKTYPYLYFDKNIKSPDSERNPICIENKEVLGDEEK